jgi:hypothetical protein
VARAVSGVLRQRAVVPAAAAVGSVLVLRVVRILRGQVPAGRRRAAVGIALDSRSWVRRAAAEAFRIRILSGKALTGFRNGKVMAGRVPHRAITRRPDNLTMVEALRRNITAPRRSHILVLRSRIAAGAGVLRIAEAVVVAGRMAVVVVDPTVAAVTAANF